MDWSVNMSSLGNIRSVIPKVLNMLGISFHQFSFWKQERLPQQALFILHASQPPTHCYYWTLKYFTNSLTLSDNIWIIFTSSFSCLQNSPPIPHPSPNYKTFFFFTFNINFSTPNMLLGG